MRRHASLMLVLAPKSNFGLPFVAGDPLTFSIQLAHENHKTIHQELLATGDALASLLCE